MTARSDIETHVDDIAVAHDVLATLEALLAALTQDRIGTGVQQFLGAGYLGADEPARDVSVNARRSVERGLAVAKIPCAHLGLAGGEERDQPEQPVGTARNAVQAGLFEAEVVQECSAVGCVELGYVVLDARRDGDGIAARARCAL